MDRRLQTLAEQYALSGDLADAMNLADEYLRTIHLNEPLMVSDMEVANISMDNIDNDELLPLSQSEYSRIWSWLEQQCCFKHTDENELIIHIASDEFYSSPIVTVVEGRLETMYDMPRQLKPIIQEAYEAGYKYLCFYG